MNDAVAGGAEVSPEAHRGFLNKYYGISRHFYDLTRKYYLFGRDREIKQLLSEDWNSLLEIGPGTGRNLTELHQGRPSARFFGVEASDEMLAHAQAKCPFAKLIHGFAESTDLSGVFAERPERILYSYCLSMVVDPDAALANSVSALSPGGEVVIVDFGDFKSIPGPFARLMRKWLVTFHVNPVSPALLEKHGAEVSFGPGRYFLRARIRAS